MQGKLFLDVYEENRKRESSKVARIKINIMKSKLEPECNLLQYPKYHESVECEC